MKEEKKNSVANTPEQGEFEEINTVTETDAQAAQSLAAEQPLQEGIQSEQLSEPGHKVYGDKVLTPKQKRNRTIRRWVLINVAIVLMALSVYFFQMPMNFVLGGVGGISIMLANVVEPLVPWLTKAVIMLIINVFLLVLGFIFLGKGCTFKTVYCCVLYTGLILLFEKVLPLDKPLTSNYLLDAEGNIMLAEDGITKLFDGGQPFLELCYAILLFGVGGAIIFNCGASSGGTDIIALILKKFTKINVGVSLLIVDLIVASASIFTIGDTSITLYSFLGLFARTFLLDGIIESFGKTKYITIITHKPDEISDYILNVIQHGLTMYDAVGGYTHEKKKILITICRRGEALRLKAKVKTFDPEAFVIITDANEILGKGFNSGF